MKISEVVAGAALVASLGAAAFGLGTGCAAGDPAPPPPPPPPPLVWAPQTPEREPWQPPPQDEAPPLPPLPPR